MSVSKKMCAALLGIAAVWSCGDDDLYPPCEEASDCEVPEGKSAVCLPKGDEGFCSWDCAADADCDGGEHPLVCASFESTPAKYCFPPCEGGEECPDGFSCRSTGGGNENRKVCFPE